MGLTFSTCHIYKILTNVLKTGPDRSVQPVQLLIGHNSDPVCPIEPFKDQTGHEPPKPAVGPVEPDGSNWTEQF